MRPFAILLFLSLLGCQGGAPAPAPTAEATSAGPEWVAYQPAGAGFRVEMPGVPQEEGRSATLGPLQVTWRDLGPQDRGKSLEMIQGDEMRKRGAVSRTSGTYANGRPALEGDVTASDGTPFRMRVFHHEYRFYVLSASGPDAQRFLDSFDVVESKAGR